MRTWSDAVRDALLHHEGLHEEIRGPVENLEAAVSSPRRPGAGDAATQGRILVHDVVLAHEIPVHPLKCLTVARVAGDLMQLAPHDSRLGAAGEAGPVGGGL